MKKTYIILPLFILIASANEAEDYSLNKNLEVFVNSKTLSIREKPYVDSKIIDIKKRDDKLEILACNKLSWCKLKSGGYAPLFLLKNENLTSLYKEEFTKDKNTYFKVQDNNIKVYTRPFYKAETTMSLFKNEIIKVKGCDSYGWCKIDNKKFIKKTYLEKTYNKNISILHKDLNDISSYKEILKDLKEELKKKTSVKKIEKKEDKSFKENYIKALNFIKSKNYKEAYKILNSLFLIKANDININFYLGLVAFELQKFTEALNAYERVLFEEPKALRTLYEKAKTLFFLNDLKNSKKIFLDLKKEKLNKQTKAQIDKYLFAIEYKRKKHHFSGAVILGTSFDSNINNAPSAAVFKNVYIPQLDITQDLNNTTKNSSDKSVDLVLALNHLYKAKENTHLKNSFLIFSKNMFRFKEKDTLYFSYSPSLEHNYNKNTNASFALLFDKLLLDDKSYIYNYGIRPSFNYIYGKNIFSTSLKYQQKKYIKEENKNKNSKLLQVVLGNKFLINKQNLSDLQFTYANERKDGGNDTINYDEYALKLAHLFRVYKNKININPALSYRYIQFDDYNTNYRKHELTKKLKFEINNNYIYNKQTIYKLGLSYEDSSSNIPNSEYDKYNLNLSLIRTF